MGHAASLEQTSDNEKPDDQQPETANAAAKPPKDPKSKATSASSKKKRSSIVKLGRRNSLVTPIKATQDEETSAQTSTEHLFTQSPRITQTSSSSSSPKALAPSPKSRRPFTTPNNSTKTCSPRNKRTVKSAADTKSREHQNIIVAEKRRSNSTDVVDMAMEDL